MADIGEIKKAVAEVIDEYIDRKTHYQHHEFIESIIKMSDRISSAVIKTAVSSIVIGFFSLLVLGLILWGRNNFK